LFNLQGTRRSRRNIAIILNFIPFVKNFFQKFFDARSVSYHQQLFKFTIPFLLCQELFSKFFDAAFQYGRCLRRFRAAAVLTALTALLEYQTIRRLSTPFFLFLKKISAMEYPRLIL